MRAGSLFGQNLDIQCFCDDGEQLTGVVGAVLPVHDAEHALFLDVLALAADGFGGLEADERFAVPEICGFYPAQEVPSAAAMMSNQPQILF